MLTFLSLSYKHINLLPPPHFPLLLALYYLFSPFHLLSPSFFMFHCFPSPLPKLSCLTISSFLITSSPLPSFLFFSFCLTSNALTFGGCEDSHLITIHLSLNVHDASAQVVCASLRWQIVIARWKYQAFRNKRAFYPLYPSKWIWKGEA